jgi:uncharacterized membrane protein (DUF485 family)
MSEKIIIEYELEEDDYKKMGRFTAWDAPYLKSKRQKTVLIMVSIIAFILAFIIYIDVNSFNKEFLLKFLVLFLLITIPMVAGFKNRVGVNIERKVSKNLVIPENNNVLGKYHLTLDSEKIYAKVDVAETNYAWDAITKISISDNHYYLHIALGIFILIPKRAFKTNEERNAFEKLLRSKMPINDYRTKNPK